MAIRPIAERYDPETGEMEFVLGPEDFEKVRQGYGCSACLADYNGVWQPRCPTCGEETFTANDLAPRDTSFRIVA